MKLSKIFRDSRGFECLSILQFFRKSVFKKNIREIFFKIGLGGPKPQGVPSKCEGLGGSLEGVDVYQMLKRSQLYLPRNSRY